MKLGICEFFTFGTLVNNNTVRPQYTGKAVDLFESWWNKC